MADSPANRSTTTATSTSSWPAAKRSTSPPRKRQGTFASTGACDVVSAPLDRGWLIADRLCCDCAFHGWRWGSAHSSVAQRAGSALGGGSGLRDACRFVREPLQQHPPSLWHIPPPSRRNVDRRH